MQFPPPPTAPVFAGASPGANASADAAAAGTDVYDEQRFAQTLAAYDYPLDPARVAQQPAEPRDAARLLQVAADGAFSHHVFADLAYLLAPGDLLVRNETRVIPARLHVTRPSGAVSELLPFAPIDGDVAHATLWRALGRPSKRLRPGTRLVTAKGAELWIAHPDEVAAALAQAPSALAAAGEPADGASTPPVADETATMAGEAPSLVVKSQRPLLAIMQEEGELPLPPYVARSGAPTAQDEEAYQTAFARTPGAVAAPTASLHFTEQTFAALRQRGVEVADVILHVGPGTFLPIRREHEGNVAAHVMHGERYEVPAATQAAIRAARANGRKVVMAGTTSLRAVETWAKTGRAHGVSRLYVRPGYSFCVADALLTNFHLPRTTLLMLVAAFCGRRRMLAAYAAAQSAGYRFFSYGDASLLHAATPRRGVVPGEPGYAADPTTETTAAPAAELLAAAAAPTPATSPKKA